MNEPRLRSNHKGMPQAMGPSNHEGAWRRAGAILDVALMAGALVYLGLPEHRTASMKFVVAAVYFAHSAVGIRKYWKAGLLTRPVGEIHGEIRRTGPLKRRPLEGAATCIGLVAMGFVLWA